MPNSPDQWEHLPPWLTNDEIADLTKPLTQAAARKRYLRKLGLVVREKPNGAPLVMRSDIEQLLGHQTHGKNRPKAEIYTPGLLAALGKS